MDNIPQSKFYIGQLVAHKLFEYRGVVADVDPEFKGTEEWYQQVAKTSPPKNQPWYRILVHDAIHETYVSEKNLMEDKSARMIVHPLVDTLFTRFSEGRYWSHRRN